MDAVIFAARVVLVIALLWPLFGLLTLCLLTTVEIPEAVPWEIRIKFAFLSCFIIPLLILRGEFAYKILVVPASMEELNASRADDE